MWPVNKNRPSKKQAQERLDVLLFNPAHLNIKREASDEEQQAVITEIEQLREIVAGTRVWLDLD